MSPEFIYTMKDLRKTVPPKREILKGIWLSFYFGAKIGVIGPNGAGKSSLLRIMAGEDGEFLGEAFPAKGIKVGFLPQEPRLDSKKTVLGNVEEGVAATRALLDRFNTISDRLGEPLEPDEMERLLEEQSKVQDQIDAANAWELDRTLEIAMDALRCPPPGADVGAISGGERRRVALCRLLLQKPDILLLDILLPKRNGYEILRALKKDDRTRRTPVVVVTARDQESDRVWSRLHGAAEYVMKPFTPEQLLAAVEKLAR